MSYRPVIRENAGSTKLRVVYDASTKSESGYSLNDCLENWSSLKKDCSKFRPVILCNDIEKAFLQIQIKEKERVSPYSFTGLTV